MDAFCPAGFGSSLSFCLVGDAETPRKAASDATCPESKRFWEVGGAEEASLQGIEDAEGYADRQGNKEEEKLSCDAHVSINAALYAFGNSFCEVGIPNDLHKVCHVNGFQEAGNAEAEYWVNPRISFSRDFAMSNTDSLSQSPCCVISSERKQGEHDVKDNYSAEFAFLKDGSAHGSPDHAKGFMLSADELFFDGKLLPLPFPSILSAGDDLSLSSSCGVHLQEGQQKPLNRPMSRHLSFEILDPLSSSCFSMRSTCPCILSPCKSLRLDKSLACSDGCVRFPSSLPSPLLPLPSSLDSLASPSSTSSMPLPPTSPAPQLPLTSTLAMAPTSALPSPPSVTKCSSKIIHLLKSKIFSKDSSPSRYARDDSVRSICRFPIPSRSFWPFSRSNSASLTKSTAPPQLPCRSNSTGVTHTCDAPSLKEFNVIDVARQSTSSSPGGSKVKGSILRACAENFHTTESTVPLEVASVEKIQKGHPSLYHSAQQLDDLNLESPALADRHASEVEGNLNVCNHRYHDVDTRVGKAESRMRSRNVKSLGFQGQSKASGKKVIVTPGKGSPVKRKGVSRVKGNGGKIMLRNLERCSAEKLGRDKWRGLNRRGSFPVGARVSPVLNMVACRGPSTPKVGLFQFNTSLFSKKEKPDEATLNWRNGA